MFKIFGFTAQSSTVTVFGYWDRANAMSVKRRIRKCLKLNQPQLHQAHNQPLNRRQRPLDMDDVGGWAFQLLCSHGERLVGSASLGPNSTNNIGEFTAIFQIVQQAAILSLDHMDIHTDSNLAVQYYENTCVRDCPHLAKLWEQTEQLAIAAHIQFRLIHVKAHANDPDNNNVDSMCTAAI